MVSGIGSSRRLRTESSTARFPNTKHSISELDASLLAPMIPDEASSPHTYKCGILVRPVRSVFTPPTV